MDENILILKENKYNIIKYSFSDKRLVEIRSFISNIIFRLKNKYLNYSYEWFSIIKSFQNSISIFLVEIVIPSYYFDNIEIYNEELLTIRKKFNSNRYFSDYRYEVGNITYCKFIFEVNELDTIEYIFHEYYDDNNFRWYIIEKSDRDSIFELKENLLRPDDRSIFILRNILNNKIQTFIKCDFSGKNLYCYTNHRNEIIEKKLNY